MLRPDEVNEVNIIPRLASRAQIQWRIAQYCNPPSFESPISLPLQSNTSHLAQQPPMASTISTNTMSSSEASATPSLAEPSTATPTIATAESNQTSLNSSDGEEDGRSRSNSRTLRPRLGTRKSSGTMIVPADHPDVEIKEESYPADDARAMSPRRSSADTERMVQEARQVAETYVLLSDTD